MMVYNKDIIYSVGGGDTQVGIWDIRGKTSWDMGDWGKKSWDMGDWKLGYYG